MKKIMNYKIFETRSINVVDLEHAVQKFEKIGLQWYAEQSHPTLKQIFEKEYIAIVKQFKLVNDALHKTNSMPHFNIFLKNMYEAVYNFQKHYQKKTNQIVRQKEFNRAAKLFNQIGTNIGFHSYRL